MSTRAAERVLTFHREVFDSCVARLSEAHNPRTRLFDRQFRDRVWDATRGTEDLTSTAICLIGLHRAKVDPRAINVDVGASLAALPPGVRDKRYPGALGLVLWANAVWDGSPAAHVIEGSGLSLEQPAVFAGLTTMETAWLVSGLLHEHRRSNDVRVRGWLERAQAELRSRFRTDGNLFSHASEGGSVQHRLRRWVANFADQIYSVQALAFSVKLGHSASALSQASACAARLVELQGKRGQWWWHYHARDGAVLQPFPVYSVHQHAMAPMALMALAEAGGADHRDAITLSNQWLRANELDHDLFDRSAGTIWRDIEPDHGTLRRLAGHAQSVLGVKRGDPSSIGPLRVNYETRPYEWAWCLYAGAIAAGDDVPTHIV